MTVTSDLLTKPEHEEQEYAGPSCPNCGAPGEDVENSWCQQCGYYGKLGTQIELDREFEQLAASDEVEAVDALQSVPPWAWKMGAIWFALFGVSVTARVLLSESPTWHSVWGVGQLLLGALVVLILHVTFFLRRMMSDDGASLMDILNPYSIWSPVFQAMPKTEKWILSGWGGAWSAVFALCIVGGLRSEWFEFEHTPVAKKKKEKPKGPTVAGGGGDGSLTDAIEDFAQQGAGGLAAPTVVNKPLGSEGEPADVGEEETEDETPLEEIECVIVGFAASEPAPNEESGDDSSQTPADAGQADESDSADGEEGSAETQAGENGEQAEDMSSIRGLILATQVGGRLRIVGTVTEGLTPELSAKLLPQLRAHLRETPFVPMRLERRMGRSRLRLPHPVQGVEPSERVDRTAIRRAAARRRMTVARSAFDRQAPFEKQVSVAALARAWISAVWRRQLRQAGQLLIERCQVGNVQAPGLALVRP